MESLKVRYFTRDELEPTSSPISRPELILSDELLYKFNFLASELSVKGRVEVEMKDVTGNSGIAVFISILRLFGAVTIESNSKHIFLNSRGTLSRDFPKVLTMMLKQGFPAFDDWDRRYKTVSSDLSPIEFLHHMELERIKTSSKLGEFPEVIRKIPVAFAIIKAYSNSRCEDVYLLELNKDWHRYNFVGGKQEDIDLSDYRTTLLREIEEELGIPRERVLLTQLNQAPLEGYSLSGSSGTLSQYPCILFSARIQGNIILRSKHIWFTEAEILSQITSNNPGLLINTLYLDYIFHKLDGGLKGLPASLDEGIFENQVINKDNWLNKLVEFSLLHKNLVITTLTVIAALIGLVVTIIGIVVK